MLPFLISGLVALGVLFAALGLRSLLVDRDRRRVQERLKNEKTVDLTTLEGASLAEHPLPPLFRAVSFFGWTLPHLALSEDLQWNLAAAGYRHSQSNRVFAGFKVLLVVLLGFGAFALASSLSVTSDKLFMATASAVILGYLAPNIWLAWSAHRRRTQIVRALPDALDLMVVCVEAGQGLNSAMVSVGSELKRAAGALSEELRLINQEIRAGLARGQALRNFADRTGVDDVRALAAVLIQSDRLGTSVARALRVHADSLRTRRRQRAEAAARKTSVKLVFPLVLCIFPELLVVILAPGMIQLVRVLMDSTG